MSDDGTHDQNAEHLSDALTNRRTLLRNLAVAAGVTAAATSTFGKTTVSPMTPSCSGSSFVCVGFDCQAPYSCSNFTCKSMYQS
jgi:curli biogenesis system outer membrane secretion channel CsgG